MDYSLPNVKDTYDALRQLRPDEVAKIRDDIKNKLETILRASDEVLEENIVSTCDICEKFGEGYNSLPHGWGWLKDGTLMCNNCNGKWTSKWGSPTVYREGELIDEQDSIIPEDTTRRGQADFGFV